MTWTPPKTTWQDGDVVAAQDMNDIGRNLQALKTPTTAIVNLDEAADLTTASAAFVDVSSTRLALTLTTQGGDVLVTFVGAVSINAISGLIYFNLMVDGALVAGEDGILIATLGNVVTTANVSFSYWLTGLAAGTHVIKLQWKVNTGTATLWAGAGTPLADLHPQFAAREVS